MYCLCRNSYAILKSLILKSQQVNIRSPKTVEYFPEGHNVQLKAPGCTMSQADSQLIQLSPEI